MALNQERRRIYASHVLKHGRVVRDITTRVGKRNAVAEVMLDDFGAAWRDVDIDPIWTIPIAATEIKILGCLVQ